MKGWFVLIAGVCMLILTSAASHEVSSPGVGGMIPTIYINTVGSESVKSDDIISGKEVIISFWSAEDASSRIANNNARVAAQSDGIRFISVCVDKEATLGSEIFTLDGIDKSSCYWPDYNKESSQSREFLKNAVGHSYHIGSDGLIQKLSSYQALAVNI